VITSIVGSVPPVAGLPVFGDGAEVGEQVVVTGKPVQRPGERVRLEDGRQEFGSEVVGGHGAEAIRALSVEGPV